MPRVNPVVLAAAAVVSAGCFRYVPLQADAVAAPAQVHIEVSPPGGVEVPSDTGRVLVRHVTSVRGSMSARSGDTLFLNDARLRFSDLSRDERRTLGESRYVTGSGDRFRMRRLAKGRTAFVILAPVALFFAYLMSADPVISLTPN